METIVVFTSIREIEKGEKKRKEISLHNAHINSIDCATKDATNDSLVVISSPFVYLATRYFGFPQKYETWKYAFLIVSYEERKREGGGRLISLFFSFPFFQPAVGWRLTRPDRSRLRLKAYGGHFVGA